MEDKIEKAIENVIGSLRLDGLEPTEKEKEELMKKFDHAKEIKEVLIEQKENNENDEFNRGNRK